MVSLTDVLLAMSNIPVDDPIAEIWGRGLQGGYEIIEYTGTPPIEITADGSALLDYRIYGKTVQDGTPTPENPVDVVGCGERTENLFDLSSYYEVSSPISGIIIEKNRITYNALGQYLAIKYKFNLGIADVYTISLGADSLNTRLELRYAKNGEYVGRAIIISPNQKTTVRGGNEYDGFYVYISNFTNTGICTASNIMLNLGSTALPYEPYGYKLPMTVSDGNTAQTVTIYLGEVQTTRRIKKLVFDGTKNWAYDSVNTRFIFSLPGMDYKGARATTFLCSHYEVVDDGRTISRVPNNTAYAGGSVANPLCYVKTDEYSSVEDFKSYLAAQYANGTPVTVWYVLAEPETGIVNEPLMKIGDYADTLSMEQADVSIPTFAGTTVIDYGGEPKPSQMYIKYRRR